MIFRCPTCFCLFPFTSSVKTGLSIFAIGLLPFSLCAQSVFDSIYVVKTAEVYFASGQAELLPDSRRSIRWLFFSRIIHKPDKSASPRIPTQSAPPA